MSKNRILSAKTLQDLDSRVERVLAGLGHPEPPLRLEDVRELLKLDLGFYTANDPGMAAEAVNRIRVASIQIYQRPTLLMDAIRKFSLKALYLPDRKRILLDGDLPAKKHRWNEAHEVGHSLIPWHEDTMLGDNSYTLSPECHEDVEAEANFVAGRLLFLRNRFSEEVRSLEPKISNVQKLHKLYGNTLSTTLYRFVEIEAHSVPLVGMISDHPHASKRSIDYNVGKPCRYFIQSPQFANFFSKVTENWLFSKVSGYCGPQRGGSLGTDEIVIPDDNGKQHIFSFETFYNHYDALTLGVYKCPELTFF